MAVNLLDRELIQLIAKRARPKNRMQMIISPRGSYNISVF